MRRSSFGSGVSRRRREVGLAQERRACLEQREVGGERGGGRVRGRAPSPRRARGVERPRRASSLAARAEQRGIAGDRSRRAASSSARTPPRCSAVPPPCCARNAAVPRICSAIERRAVAGRRISGPKRTPRARGRGRAPAASRSAGAPCSRAGAAARARLFGDEPDRSPRRSCSVAASAARCRRAAASALANDRNEVDGGDAAAADRTRAARCRARRAAAHASPRRRAGPRGDAAEAIRSRPGRRRRASDSSGSRVAAAASRCRGLSRVPSGGSVGRMRRRGRIRVPLAALSAVTGGAGAVGGPPLHRHPARRHADRLDHALRQDDQVTPPRPSARSAPRGPGTVPSGATPSTSAPRRRQLLEAVLLVAVAAEWRNNACARRTRRVAASPFGSVGVRRRPIACAQSHTIRRPGAPRQRADVLSRWAHAAPNVAEATSPARWRAAAIELVAQARTVGGGGRPP